MNTAVLKDYVETWAEEFGENTRLDLVMTLNHEFIKSLDPDATIVHFSMKEGGIWSIHMPIGLQLLVETSPNHWEVGRNMTATIDAAVNLTWFYPVPNKPFFNISFYDLDLPTLKIFKGEEEMYMEEMLIQTVANL